jgi:DNA-binding response OmpR family regulator
MVKFTLMNTNTGQKTILVIEDETAIRENIVELLELADYKVLVAENGKVGVEIAKTSSPDLILCDIMMPELDGYGVIKILSKNYSTSTIPFIFLTAKSEKTDIRKGMMLGADDYITKPFLETELLDAIDNRLKRYEMLQQNFGMDLDQLTNYVNVAGYKALEQLCQNRKQKSFHKKEEIYRQGDAANYLYLITKGCVKCVSIDSYGKTMVNEIHGVNTFIGYVTLMENTEYHESAIAMEDTVVTLIPRIEFVDLIKSNSEVASHLINLLSHDVQDREQRMIQLAYAPVRERIAATLIKLQDKSIEHRNHKDINISREDLAAIVGTTKESLIRTLTDMKKDGYIDSDGHLIEILNQDELNRIACK